MFCSRLFVHPILLGMSISVSTVAAASDPQLDTVLVKGNREAAEQLLAPTTREGVSRQEITQTVNAINTEDTFKYLPNVLVRKRFIGDTDAPISSRTTGINASARTLVYADSTLLTPLINNNNGNGSPRWFMVSPEEIERVDVMYGPFSAAYPGNSYGLVANVITRMPTKLEGSIKVSGAWQDFDRYGTDDTYTSRQGSVAVGNRIDNFSFWVSVNHLDSHSMPVSFAVNPNPSGTAGMAISGGYSDANRFGDRDRPAGVSTQILGATSTTHTVQDNTKIKLAYDLSPTLRAAYTFGLWRNDADLTAQSYLTNSATGSTYWGATSGQATVNGSNYSASALSGLFQPGHKDMEHHMHALSLSERSDDALDWTLAISKYEYRRNQERTANTGSLATYSEVAAGAGTGKTIDMKGTGWTTADASGTWRSDGALGAHTVSGGAHYDLYSLRSPTYNTSSWLSGGNGSLFADSRGKTETRALWLQEVWRFAPHLHATLGLRQEWWNALDGENFAGTTTVVQPQRAEAATSPKVSLTWEATSDLQVTGSLGRAVRFPTVGELYLTQTVSGVVQTSDPTLKPEKVLSGELAVEYLLNKGKLRTSIFEEQVSDALISQSGIYPGIAAVTSFMQNVDKTRQRGIEIVVEKDDVLINRLQLSGSVTYVDARILANDGYVPPAWNPGGTSVGKHTPYVPDWRATLVATYRPQDDWAFTLAGRYSGRMYATVDGTDINSDTYMSFDKFFVADARISHQLDAHWSAALGVDNLNNRKYFLFHPFPQRTAFAEIKFEF